MKSRFLVLSLVAIVSLTMALYGCKGKTDSMTEEVVVSETVAAEVPQSQEMLAAQAQAQQTVIEPSATVAAETIPPTAALGKAAAKACAAVSTPAADRNKDIQTALKNAGFYTGAIDGKIGPKTKGAVTEFQKAKGLKADGKVGPKTWVELEKYLLKQ